jgi:hypothetical protein
MQNYWIAGALLLATCAAQAREPKTPADVIVYTQGVYTVPSPVDQRARMQVTWMYDQIGVHLLWHAGKPATRMLSGGAVVIQVDFTDRIPPDQKPAALAFAKPFDPDAAEITVMYDRLILAVSGRPSLEPALLAHVLTHEIGHVLKRTDEHTGTGVMKAHWDTPEFDAMAGKSMAFEPADVKLIHSGLESRRARAALN